MINGDSNGQSTKWLNTCHGAGIIAAAVDGWLEPIPVCWMIILGLKSAERWVGGGEAEEELERQEVREAGAGNRNGNGQGQSQRQTSLLSQTPPQTTPLVLSCLKLIKDSSTYFISTPTGCLVDKKKPRPENAENTKKSRSWGTEISAGASEIGLSLVTHSKADFGAWLCFLWCKTFYSF